MPLAKFNIPANSSDWIDESGRMTRGKHRGSLLETVARDDPDYLQWVMDLDDTSVSERRIIATSLKYIR